MLYELYQNRLRRELDGADLPHHVAMIVDGNRRWAKQRMLETAAHGHRAGAAKISEFLTWCDDLGIRVVTLYLLSADNLGNRASDELTELFGIIGDVADELSQQRDWRVQHVGATDDLPEGSAARSVVRPSGPPTRRACTSTWRSATAAVARSPTPCAASSASTTPTAAPSTRSPRS
nr:hypothetical protein GCM10025699_61100 [Microbacterium flavescens]